ncbi:MAG: A24 family peptidase [Candidatus Aenigmatarchaeota archaeon]
MLEIAIGIAVAGLVISGIWDLMTTEVPDEIPIMMVFSGIFLWYINAMITGDFAPLAYSLIIGTTLLAVGLILYKKGKWGGADAWLLAAVAYLIPLYKGVFIFSFMINLVFVSSAYMIVYSLVLGAMNRWVFLLLLKDIKDNFRIVVLIPAMFFLFMLFSIYLIGFDIRSVSMFVLITAMTMFWRYALVIEKNVFKKKIATSRLKVGDVLDEMIWRGLTDDEVKKIRREKRFVVIKEGVRFVPAYTITLVVTLIYGNLFWMML